MTTLSFLPCAGLGDGAAATSTAAVIRNSFLNMRFFSPDRHTLLIHAHPAHKRLAGMRKRLRYYRLGLVAGGQMRRPDLTQCRRRLAAVLVGQRTANGIGTAG